ncbi:MAG: DegT/DnrJ/EryC1/StrS family aminotransferase [Anaerolineales bacterium]|jgi:dTDP-4-amino-4,6-dideoxygalactose transaminase
MSANIPFVDLRAQHEEIRNEIETSIKDIIDRSSFIGGNYVANFEREFASYLGAEQVVGVASGTDALWLGLISTGVEPGDAVVTVPNTFIATVEAITRAGAYPLFVDIDLQTANMDVDALQVFLEAECHIQDDGRVIHSKTGRRIAAVLPVHLYGLPANMRPILALAAKYHLPVVEDACQAHGARYRMNGDWKRAGTLGAVAGFSFYPGKNLGAMGDAGAVVTNDSELADQMRWLRDHGQSQKYIHVSSQGWNSRLDAIQAAVLSAKLQKLDEWNARRRRAAALYREALAELPLDLPIEPDYAEHVYHLYVVRATDRESLRKELSVRGIGVGLHYPIPLHLQKAYEYLGVKEGAFPNTERSASTILSLPMHPALSLDQIERVGEVCADFLLN